VRLDGRHLLTRRRGDSWRIQQSHFEVESADANNGTLQYLVNGTWGLKTITQLNFASGTAPSAINYTDVWRGGTSQSGWGVALFQEGTVLAGAWYTYNSQGQAVWYLINGGSWTNATTYSRQ
jgi:hypothetical protein